MVEVAPLIFKASAIFGTNALSKTPKSDFLVPAGFVNGPSILKIVLSEIVFLTGIINLIAG